LSLQDVAVGFAGFGDLALPGLGRLQSTIGRARLQGHIDRALEQGRVAGFARGVEQQRETGAG